MLLLDFPVSLYRKSLLINFSAYACFFKFEGEHDSTSDG